MQPNTPALIAVNNTTGQGLVHQVFCRGCGAAIHESAPICPKCGAPQLAGVLEKGRKNRMVAAVLAFILGAVGGHKFYLDQIGLGIFYLVFCWTLIPGIIAFIEGIVYLTMSDASFAKKYG